MTARRELTWSAVLWLTALTAIAYAGQGPRIRLRYSPPENVSYLVERTMKANTKLNGQEPEVLCEQAVIRYREARVDGEGWIQVAPDVHLVSAEGTMQRLKRLHTLPEHPEPAFRPLVRYGHRGESGARSEIHFIAREFDGFPIFPEEMVTTGDAWSVSKRMKFPCPDCWFSANIAHVVDTLERRNGVLHAKITYTLSGHLATAAHPELQSNQVVGKLNPEFVLDGKGSVWFDCSRGVIVEKTQHIRWSKASTAKMSARVRRGRPTVTEFDQEFSADISV